MPPGMFFSLFLKQKRYNDKNVGNIYAECLGVWKWYLGGWGGGHGNYEEHYDSLVDV